MSSVTALAVKEKVDDLLAHGGYHKLILLVGPARSGKTTALRELAAGACWPRLNVNLLLSERLIEVPSRFREIRVIELLREVTDAAPGEVLVLDNIELLFQRSLQIDPLQALLALSRSRVVVAAWCGEYRDGVLSYAASGHQEYRPYTDPGCIILPVALSTMSSSTRAPKVVRA